MYQKYPTAKFRRTKQILDRKMDDGWKVDRILDVVILDKNNFSALRVSRNLINIPIQFIS